MLARREIYDAPVRLPLSEAVPKVTLHAGRSLVAFFGRFREQFHHDHRDTGRNSLDSLSEAAPDALRCGNGPIQGDRTRDGKLPVSIS